MTQTAGLVVKTGGFYDKGRGNSRLKKEFNHNFTIAFLRLSS